MTMIHEPAVLDKGALAASVFAVAKNDVRKYLNHVKVELVATEGGYQARYISLNGCLMTVFTSDHLCAVPGGESKFEILIPVDVIKAAVKSKQYTVSLRQIEDKEWALDGRIFTPCEEQYPQWERLVPSINYQSRDAVMGIYNPEYLILVKKAFDKFYGSRPASQEVYRMEENPEGTTLTLHRGKPDAVAILTATKQKFDEYPGIHLHRAA